MAFLQFFYHFSFLEKHSPSQNYFFCSFYYNQMGLEAVAYNLESRDVSEMIRMRKNWTLPIEGTPMAWMVVKIVFWRAQAYFDLPKCKNVESKYDV